MKLLNDFGFPVYINPTFNEILNLKETKWDTLRICTDENVFCVASGYGFTHQCVINMYKKHIGVKRWHPSTFIIFREEGEIFFNLEDVSGNRRARPIDAKQYFEDHEWEFVQLILDAE